jgi:hypothetical protein
VVKLAGAQAKASEGTLTIAFSDGELALELGPAAAKWAAKITSPPSLMKKLGVKPEQRISLIGNWSKLTN